MDGIPNKKQMKNAHPFCIVFQVLKVLLIKICKIQPRDILAFTSANIIFHKFFELHSLSEKKDFRHNLSLFVYPNNTRMI